MNKKMYLGVGVLLGALLATAGGAAAEQINTLIGKTVAGEYNVRVNGSALSESAIVVDGKAHVPLRAVSDSLGADLVVNGKTIEINTGVESSSTVSVPEQSDALSDNPYATWSKESIVDLKAIVEQSIQTIESDTAMYEKALQRVDKNLSSAGDDQSIIDRVLESAQEDRANLERIKIKKVELEKDLELLNAALATK
ncbi:2,' 3'-cyclic nucleotide 2'-phosphodiesterase [Paenibacillus medicaginis]|uniref:2,' 3'-cyclic nucleotide 2'-phosphodiesterase n=1 Tax=Paenibacillus medicaginis TaxID=1470560 RepID=A0ABV5C405_9BACL